MTSPTHLNAEAAASHLIVAPVARSRILHHDLLVTVIHECGHAVVGDYLGVEKSRVELRLESGVDYMKWISISGTFGHFPRLSRGRTQVLSLAGIVAEALAQDEEWSAPALLDAIECGDTHLSDTDRAGAGRITERLLDRCAVILRGNWPSLVDEALHHATVFGREHRSDGDVTAAVALASANLEGLRGRFSAEGRRL